MASKGQGGGGCCCGGCWAPPSDPRGATTADIIEVQQYCCRCIPKYLCAIVSETGYDDASVLMTRDCSADYVGDPIQFSGLIRTRTGDLTLKVRLSVSGGQCYITYEIAETEDTGTQLIDHTVQASIYDCAAGMTTEACVNFGGEWTLADTRTLTISPPDTFDIASNIRCAGCSCICKCMCISVASQAGDGSITIVGSNELACAVVGTRDVTNCAGDKIDTVKYATWTAGDWAVQLDADDTTAPDTYTVYTGTETSFAPCTITEILRFYDEEVHEIAAVSSSVNVVYEFNIDDKTPLAMRWIGRSHDEGSVVTFEAYNWSLASYEMLGTETGVATGSDQIRMFNDLLDADNVGTGADLGKVRIRIKADYCDDLITDLLIIKTTSCCKLELLPPGSVVPTTELEKVDLSQVGFCPEVFKFWQFEDESGTLWYVSIDCAWCGGKCGSVSTDCCGRPVSRTLFAEVSIGCGSCEGTAVVPLFANAAGTIWEGTGTHCNQDLDVSLSCGGGFWSITVEGAGACSFSDTAGTVDCDPFYLTFLGRFAGGIGCCGVGSIDTDVSISIVVFE